MKYAILTFCYISQVSRQAEKFQDLVQQISTDYGIYGRLLCCDNGALWVAQAESFPLPFASAEKFKKLFRCTGDLHHLGEKDFDNAFFTDFMMQKLSANAEKKLLQQAGIADCSEFLQQDFARLLTAVLFFYNQSTGNSQSSKKDSGLWKKVFFS